LKFNFYFYGKFFLIQIPGFFPGTLSLMFPREAASFETTGQSYQELNICVCYLVIGGYRSEYQESNIKHISF